MWRPRSSAVLSPVESLRSNTHDQQVGQLPMEFLHDGRPPVIREARYTPPAAEPLDLPAAAETYNDELLMILASLNVASKEWVIRQYDHEVQAGSVVKPLVGVANDGPGDAAVLRPKTRLATGGRRLLRYEPATTAISTPTIWRPVESTKRCGMCRRRRRSDPDCDLG